MKVFGISCGRRSGNSEILLKQAFMAIENSCGAETAFVRLQDAEIKSCTGCESCMRQHIAGNWEFRCVHKKEEDHFFFIESMLREADAIIFSTPVYNLQPAGILTRLFNKLHASGDYRELVKTQPKLGAAITVGGTDWTNFGMTFAAMAVSEFCGTFDNIVDTLKVDFCPAPGAVLLEPEVMARAYKLGENVAAALMKGKRAGAYAGPEGVCPYCHGTLLEYRSGELWCPMCESKADFSIEDGKLKVSFSEDALAHSRWAPYGQDLHIENIAKGHKKAALGSDTIKENLKKYEQYKAPVSLPELHQH